MHVFSLQFLTELQYLIPLYAGPVLLLIVWLLVRRRSSARLALCRAWLVAMAGAIGFSTFFWPEEATLLGCVVSMVSGCLFLGPVLIMSIGKRWHPARCLFAALVVPPVSCFLLGMLLVLIGQATF